MQKVKEKHPKVIIANYDSESHLLTIADFIRRQLEIHFSSLQNEVVCIKQELKKAMPYEEWTEMEG